MRKTPFMRLRYPWASDVVSVGDVESLASDVDQALVQTASLANNFSRFSSVVVKRTALQSITKGTLTAISFDTSAPALDNGTDSPLANGPWFNAAAPTRLTAPSPCVVLACGSVAYTYGTALGVNGILQLTIALNGATAAPGVQGSKWGPISTFLGQQQLTGISMWKLNAGDFLELKTFWTGTPVGPINTDANGLTALSLMMVALPTVP